MDKAYQIGLANKCDNHKKDVGDDWQSYFERDLVLLKMNRGEYSFIWVDEISGNNYLVTGKNYNQQKALTENFQNLGDS